jgi:hypothetical protein
MKQDEKGKVGNPNIGEEGKKFQFLPGDPRINRKGRPKGVFTQLKQILKKENEYEIKGELTVSDYKKLCRWMLELNEDDLGRLAQDKKTPIFIKMVAFAIAKDIKSGKLDVFDNIYEKFLKNTEKQKTAPVVFLTNFPIDPLDTNAEEEIIEESEEGEE